MRRQSYRSQWLTLISCLLLWLSACSLPQVKAEDRIFLPLSLEFLGEYRLPGDVTVEDTAVGGLSALAYDRSRNLFYALSDDSGRSGSAARFYTLKLDLDQDTHLQQVRVAGVTSVKNERGEPYPPNGIDPEGMALAPDQTLWVASEGLTRLGVPPLLGAFDLQTGALQQALQIPDAHLPDARGSAQKQGVANNLGFESLTLNPEGDRLFAATETALLQDYAPEDGEIRSRFLHYWVGEPEPVLISEHLYRVEPAPAGTLINGLVELAALDSGGHFLSLERAYTPLGGGGYSAQVFQLATGGATDISQLASLKGPLPGIQPIRKRLLLDLGELNLPLENLEGMTLGPRLPDGSQSLVLVSDNHFDPKRPSQFLLFRLQAE